MPKHDLTKNSFKEHFVIAILNVESKFKVVLRALLKKKWRKIDFVVIK